MPLALNVFQTVTAVVSTSPTPVYTAPVGYTGVILLAQVANIGTNSHDISVFHQRSVVGVAVTTEMMKNYPVSGNDTISLFSGKLILESGDKLVISGSSSTDLKLVASILETLN